MSRFIKDWLTVSNEESTESPVIIQDSETPKEGFGSAAEPTLADDVDVAKPAVAEIPAASEGADEGKDIDQGHQKMHVSAEEVEVSGSSATPPTADEQGVDHVAEATTVAKVEPAEAGDEQKTPESDDQVDGTAKDTQVVEVNHNSDNVDVKDHVVSNEGFFGGLLGFLTGGIGWAPFVGPAIHAGVKAKRLKLREDIETIAKRIEKIRKGQIDEATKNGLELPKSMKNVNSVEIIKSAVLGQFFGALYGARQGSELQNLNNDLQKKLKELEAEMEAAGISNESYSDMEVISLADAAATGPSMEDVQEAIEEMTKMRTALEGYRGILQAGIDSGEGVTGEMAQVIRIGIESLDESFAEEQVVLSQEAFGVTSSRLTATTLTVERIDRAIGQVDLALNKANACLA